MPRLSKPTYEEKLNIVIEKNTFYQKKDPEIEQEYQAIIDNIIECLKKLKQHVKLVDASKPVVQQLRAILARFLQVEEYGIASLLTLTGLSDEKFYRIVSFLRIAYQSGLFKSESKWVKERFEEGSLEWKMEEIKRRLRRDEEFARDVSQILLGENPLLKALLTKFDAKKLHHGKILHIPDGATIDTLARCSLFGSYNAKKGKSAEQIIEEILNEMSIQYESGEVTGIRATIDFVIPSKANPKIFIQSSYQGTTSSTQSRKARDELGIREDIKKNYPNAIFMQFIDGIGWIIRMSDLKTLVQAGDYVFTFHEEQLEKFKNLLSELLSEEDYRSNLRKFFNY